MVSVLCFAAWFQCRFQSGFIVPVSKPFQRSGSGAVSKRFQRWPSGLVLSRPSTCSCMLTGVSMSTRPVSESSCPEIASRPVSNLVSESGFRAGFQSRFQDSGAAPLVVLVVETRLQDPDIPCNAIYLW